MLQIRGSASADEHFDQLGFVSEDGMVQGVVPVFVDFRRIGAEPHQRFHDFDVSISRRDVKRSFAFDFHVDDRVERCDDE